MRWPMFERVQRQARRLEDVMQRLDVDIVEAAREARGASMALARERCLTCLYPDRCARWLGALGSNAASLPDFCSNAAFLRSFIRGGRP